MTGSIKMRHLGLMILAFVFCVTLVGCGSKVTKDNYAKIKAGQSEKEVKDVLGEPTESKDAEGGIKGKMMTWKSGNDTIEIVFLEGKAVGIGSSWDLEKLAK